VITFRDANPFNFITDSSDGSDSGAQGGTGRTAARDYRSVLCETCGYSCHVAKISSTAGTEAGGFDQGSTKAFRAGRSSAYHG
jgi:hypothetical protein